MLPPHQHVRDHRFTSFARLNAVERGVLATLATSRVRHPRHTALWHEGDVTDGIFLLHEGWVAGSTMRGDGGRTITKFYLPGDVPGAASLSCDRATETLCAMTSVVVSRVPARALGALFTHHPRLAALLFVLAQQEGVMLADRLASQGRSRAECSMAALIVRLYDSLRLIDPSLGATIDFPVTQEEMADALGLTSVHVNRTMRELHERGFLHLAQRRMRLIDIESLRRLAGIVDRPPALNLDWLPASPCDDPAARF